MPLLLLLLLLPEGRGVEWSEYSTPSDASMCAPARHAQVLAGELCARMGPTVDALRFADADRLTAGEERYTARRLHWSADPKLSDNKIESVRGA